MEQIKNGHASPLILSAKDVEVKFNLRGKTLTAVRGASLDQMCIRDSSYPAGRDSSGQGETEKS